MCCRYWVVESPEIRESVEQIPVVTTSGEACPANFVPMLVD